MNIKERIKEFYKLKILCNIRGKHEWDYKPTKYIRYDDMGYPLQLHYMTCKVCGKTTSMYIDVAENFVTDEKIKNGELLIIETITRVCRH